MERSTLAYRDKFYKAKKVDGESVESWATRLRGLSVGCRFSKELEVLLRDRFVLGFQSGPERDRLWGEEITALTFAKAFAIAQQVASAEPCASVEQTEPSLLVGNEKSLFEANFFLGHVDDLPRGVPLETPLTPKKLKRDLQNLVICNINDWPRGEPLETPLHKRKPRRK